MSPMDRRHFLKAAGGVGGALLLGGCGSSSSSSSSTPASARPPIGKEPGKLSILEWDGYQAFGTATNNKAGGLSAGADYIKKYGADSVTYALIQNDSEALNKVRTGAQFDIMHPCIENLPDYVNSGLIQPWDKIGRAHV